MHKLHIALAVKNLTTAVAEYTQRLGCEPVAIAKNRYALWRADISNLSITQDSKIAGTIRHIGFETQDIVGMVCEYDADGIEWEYFTAEQQRLEIIKHYPDIDYPITSLKKE